MKLLDYEFTDAYPLRPGVYRGKILNCEEKTINTKVGKKLVWQFDLLLKTEIGDCKTSTIEFVENNQMFNQLNENLVKTYGDGVHIDEHIKWDLYIYLDASYHYDNKYYMHVIYYEPVDFTLLMSKEDLDKIERYEDEMYS